MDYYDGNTVTGLWNYAQNYAMSDNNYDTNFGPSTPGALNLISGNDGGGYAVNPTTGATEPDPGSVSPLNSSGLGTIYGDLDPAYDDCSDASHTSTNPVGVMTGENIGNLLNARNVSWGWFQGGFAPTGTNSGRLRGLRLRAREHRRQRGPGLRRRTTTRSSTTSPRPTPSTCRRPPKRPSATPTRPTTSTTCPTSTSTLKDGNLPAVSFLKAAAYQDAHPGYSDPLDEQTFLVNTINQIEQSKYWSVHGDRDHLRRLRRLVRPPGLADRQRLQHLARTRRSAPRRRSRWAATPTAAASARGCRWW